MSPTERGWRSRLAQIVAGQGLLHGTLQERLQVCGKPTCRCARGQKHRALYLVVRQEGKLRQLYVPKDWEERVRQWVANDQALRDLLKELSGAYWEKVRRRQG
jgi:hypothetical protein